MLIPGAISGRRSVGHFLQELAHRIELRAETFPISCLQSLHRLIVAIERLPRLACHRAYWQGLAQEGVLARRYRP